MEFLVDTDHFVILQRRAQPEWTHLRKHLHKYRQSDYSLSSVSFHEQILGANTFISRAKSRSQVVLGYRMLERSLADYQKFIVLPFDDDSAVIFDHCRSQGLRIGTMDLRIAAIALQHDLTLLTRLETRWISKKSPI